MKILMSAFACCPGKGSEEGVGWNWAVQAASQGHEVAVLTQTCDRRAIEAEIAKGQLPEGLSFDFLMPAWPAALRKVSLKLGMGGMSDHLTHLAWQFAVPGHVRKHYRQADFDIVHHITYGGIRHPTLLGRLALPLVLGPLGGGERAPYRLRRSYHWRGWLYDLLRDIHTWSLKLDPITRLACADAPAIYVETPQSKSALPRRHHHKISVHTEIGTHQLNSPPPSPPRRAGGPLRLIYAGRFLYWKGMNMGLRAVAEARARGVDVRLTMVGSGPDEGAWRRLAGELGLGDTVDWRGWVPQSELIELYRSHDALLFPSLHDSSGNVVLEAFVNAVPVICLDLGGPAEMTDASCGMVVPVEGRSVEDCVGGLAGAIEAMNASADFRERLSRGAHAQARRYRWADVVRALYGDVEHRLRNEAPVPRRVPRPLQLEQ